MTLAAEIAAKAREKGAIAEKLRIPVQVGR
jgi:hypothetical protein